MQEIINTIIWFYTETGVTFGLLWVLFVTLFFIITFKFFRNSSFYLFFEFLVESIYNFFEDILGNEEKRWIKIYVTCLFFIILFSNLFWVFLELFLPIFWHHMEEIVSIPTADVNFNIAMAVVWLLIILIEQFRALGFWKAIYEYFPILWKDYIPYTRWNLPAFIDWPIFIVIKFFDIVISVFLWLLEIVWHWAKIISLSFRLFWNVTSGWILLAMLFTALWWLTYSIAWFEFPVLWPIIIYFQELLVALIQALVFPLLIAIFVKVAKTH